MKTQQQANPTQPTKFDNIQGRITQIQQLAEAGGLNAVSIKKGGKDTPVESKSVFNAINTVARVAEMEIFQALNKIYQAKLFIEIATNQGGTITNKDGEPLTSEELLERAFNDLSEAQTQLESLIDLNKGNA
ncbi:hypothetical protein JO83_12875 [Avibacterium paragallinarum]|uniref:Uncharacterized protein n=1 Tax=Avibacterium paragallinarum TaxID=728 RepID=A0A0F5F1A5_AVIPA|nr:hypothetical protein [Avibacterium paragallinarum]KAA6209765.1 hypothetical protein F1968_02340 [Avibacterium paragallinarum]KKB02420.1 hypothetical protein Z012_01165 [Avibacterium paragallinarum]RZN60145.1 hypothetical protein EIG79_04325 [Avibacterium paragallinarum]RZN73971.1 hypothetical protein EIG77_01480 [Avibacterium paragallinarum]TID11890.1 hypothetical protein JO83_12875 [Avibacterium paragallinarum]